MSTTTNTREIDLRADRRLKRLARLRLALIVALALQVLLGMANNLWLHQHSPDLQTATPQSLLSAHEDVAYVILALGIWFLVEALRVKRRTYVVASVTGVLGVVLALASGLTYWATEADIWSMSMTVGFAIAVTSYALARSR